MPDIKAANVLLVDDKRENLVALERSLEGLDCRFLTATSGQEALFLLMDHEFALVLLDVQMPEMDGFETAVLMRKTNRAKHTPIIFVTAINNDQQYVFQGYESGAVDYLFKPINPEILRSKVRVFIELYQKNALLHQEIAERKRIEEELRRTKDLAESANQAKSLFLANMSHELRTPLTAIIGFSQMLAHTLSLSTEEQENFDIILRSGEHLLTLINQVLDLSKIEAGRITLDEEDCDVHLLLHELEDMFRLRTMHSGLTLRFERSDDVPQYIRTDPVKLRQVLINLLNNAVKFTQEGGVTVLIERVRVHPQTPPMTLQFSIRDTGTGIAAHELDTLFEAFSQTETGRQLQEGTGLGLSISRKFVQLMGGDIHVSSDVGYGSTFSFDIQVHTPDKPAKTSRQSERWAISVEPGQAQYRMLIVDDNANTRKLFLKLLRPFGFEMQEASNGVEALKIWGDWHPHVVWMDVRMPVMDGCEAVKRIRRADTQHTLIFAVSASSFDEERAAVLSNGCDDFLQKPFQHEEVFDLLHKHLGIRFTYKDASPLTLTSRLTADMLTGLPKGLRDELRHAAVVLDLNLINHIIGKIRQHDASLADELKNVASHYRFDLLQKYFEE